MYIQQNPNMNEWRKNCTVKCKTTRIKRKVQSFLRDQNNNNNNNILPTKESELALNPASLSKADAIAQEAIFIKFKKYDCELVNLSLNLTSTQTINQ